MEFQKFRPIHNPKTYPAPLYKSETINHEKNLSEYFEEISFCQESMVKNLRPNLNLIKQQPELSLNFRLKLIDFLLKISQKLKIIPFVFFKAVKLFDRYCSKRIVLTDQAQLVICTCLWLAAKLIGGCNHFVYSSSIPTGGRFNGPSQRSRIPKLNEFVKLCGKSCNYDEGMFVQMELHILQTLNWEVNDPSIEEFLIDSKEFNLNLSLDSIDYEIFKMKEYLSYVSLYSNELIDVNIMELSLVIKEMINDSLGLTPFDSNYQNLTSSILSDANSNNEDIEMDYYPSPVSPSSSLTISASSIHSTTSNLNFESKSLIKLNLMKALLNSSEFILSMFNSSGPKQVYIQSIDKLSNSSTNSSSIKKQLIYSKFNSNYIVTTPTSTINQTNPLAAIGNNQPQMTNVNSSIMEASQPPQNFYKNNNDSSTLFDYIVSSSTQYFSKVSTPIQSKFPIRRSVSTANSSFIPTPPHSSKNSPRSSIRTRILG